MYKSGVGCESGANTYKLNRQDESTHGASTHESRNEPWGLLNNGSVHQLVNQTIIVSINHTMGASIGEWLAGLLAHRLKEWRVVSLNQSLIRCNSTTHFLNKWTFDTVSHYLIIWPTDSFLILKYVSKQVAHWWRYILFNLALIEALVDSTNDSPMDALTAHVDNWEN